MSTYVNQVNPDTRIVAGMVTYPYNHDPTSDDISPPNFVPYSGWASYKNVISGNYNRRPCWKCSSAQGIQQDIPGVYPLNISLKRPQEITEEQAYILNERYRIYQETRMNNNPGIMGINANYHNKERYNLYPIEYVKGHWPDEQISVTRTPVINYNTVINPNSNGVCRTGSNAP